MKGFASVTMIVADSARSPEAGSRNGSHSPAKDSGVPSAAVISQGCRAPLAPVQHP